ncbi:MAG: hypothetical protein HKN20_13955 [Gemmatimonadetes bacterium]|nr:hypothetical protein [Gemmatimonadota bacterium]
MKRELKRVEPMRTANVAALVYALLMSVFALIALPFFLLAAIFSQAGGGGGAPEAMFPFLLVVAYPFFGLVMGWITGLITSFIYNFVVRWSGGLLFEFDEAAPAAAGGEAV